MSKEDMENMSFLYLKDVKFS